MKVRNGFVSNSSSSSFVLIGYKSKKDFALSKMEIDVVASKLLASKNMYMSQKERSALQKALDAFLLKRKEVVEEAAKNKEALEEWMIRDTDEDYNLREQIRESGKFFSGQSYSDYFNVAGFMVTGESSDGEVPEFEVDEKKLREYEVRMLNVFGEQEEDLKLKVFSASRSC